MYPQNPRLFPATLCTLLFVAFVEGKSKLAPALATQPLPVQEYTAQVTGTLPAWLQGTMIRNVPNVYEAGDDQVRSWVDPLASIHLYKFGNASVTHTARNLETPAYTQAMQHNGFPYNQFYTPKHPGPRPTGGHIPFPCSGGPCIPDPSGAVPEAPEELGVVSEQDWPWKPSIDGINPNVDVARYVSKNGTEMFLALTDQNIFTAFNRVDASTTEPGPCMWKDEACEEFQSNSLLSAAHEKFDYNTGEHFNFLQKPGTIPKITHNTLRLTRFKDGSDTFARFVGPEHQTSNISFIHSSHLTENFFIVQQPPVNFKASISSLFSCPFNMSKFDPQVSVQWHLLDRQTGERKALISANTTEWVGPNPGLSRQTFFRGEGLPGSFFHTHTLNAFEKGDDIVMDFVGFPDNAIFYGVGLELMIDNPRDYMSTWQNARLTRCTVTPSSGRVRCEVLVDVNLGLPCFNVERYQTKEYRFAYGTSIQDPDSSDFIDRLIKLDVNQRKVVATWNQTGTFVTEPVFVAKPDGVEEDDGVILSTIFDAEVGLSSVVVLDARDLSEIAKVQLQATVNAHFHGKFCKAYGDRTCVGL